MKYDYVIIHGSFGNPFENWIPWIYDKLTQNGKDVLVPHFPSNEGQNFNKWFHIFNNYDEFIDDNTVLIGHSLGPAFITSYMIEQKKTLKGIVLISPFYDLLGIEEFDNVNKTFFKYPKQLHEIKNLAHFRHCFYSDNDPYVDISKSEFISKKIESDFDIVKNGGHLNSSSGYSKFEKLYKLLDEWD